MADVVACVFRISGRVQGVGFRAATRREALQREIHGHAINRDDGSVEVLAQGAAAAVDELARWLERGPCHAQVSKVLRDEIRVVPRAGFGVG